MWRNILFCVLFLQLGWTLGVPAGVGVYSYQDSAGNRYGGSYELDDALYFGKAPGATPQRNGWGNFPTFQPFVPNYQQFDDFFPEYFSNLENLLQEAFNKDLENQRLAFNAAKKAFDLTSNHAGYIPHSPGRFGNFGGDFPFMPMSTRNSAFAGGAAGPGFTHQIAALDPESDNPMMRNVNVMNRFADTAKKGGNGFYSVSSSSFASSSDVNGQRSGHRAAETIVNNNGEVTRYKIQS